VIKASTNIKTEKRQLTTREYSLKGLLVKDLVVNPDERGHFMEIMRASWPEMAEEPVVQANMSYSYPGMVRAWHRHLRGQIDLFFVVSGALKICAYDDVTRQLVEVIACSARPSVVRVPGHYWHGFKNLADTPSTLVYFVNRLYDPTDPDEERRLWNDPTLVPASINGNPHDPRAGKIWDWFHPPHK
jgi:dTDP-4-dehydrorhamnose 3,5-epimerase